jgi:uncharacterized membrane protein
MPVQMLVHDLAGLVQPVIGREICEAAVHLFIVLSPEA